MYYGLLAVLSAIFLLKPGGNSAARFFHDLPYFLTYTSNLIVAQSFMSISWTLAAEEQFYLLWPPIEKFLKRFAVPILLLVIAINQLIAFRIGAGWLHSCAGDPDKRSDVPDHVHSHLPGRALGPRSPFAPGVQPGRSLLALPWMPVVLLALLILACNVLVSEDIQGWPRGLIQVLMVMLLASCVVREDHWLQGFLRLSPVRRIGVVSYGIYLYHMVAAFFTQALLDRSGLHFAYAHFVLTLALTWMVAELSFRYYETPFLKLKERFESRNT